MRLWHDISQNARNKIIQRLFSLIQTMWTQNKQIKTCKHGLRTPNEGINQRYLKNWADVADIYAAPVPKNSGLGLNFRPCSEGYLLSGRP